MSSNSLNLTIHYLLHDNVRSFQNTTVLNLFYNCYITVTSFCANLQKKILIKFKIYLKINQDHLEVIFNLRSELYRRIGNESGDLISGDNVWPPPP